MLVQDQLVRMLAGKVLHLPADRIRKLLRVNVGASEQATLDKISWDLKGRRSDNAQPRLALRRVRRLCRTTIGVWMEEQDTLRFGWEAHRAEINTGLPVRAFDKG